MRIPLFWKLFALNLLALAFVVLVVWGAVDYFAGGYFITLMEKYHISPKESHRMFVDSVHRYLIGGSLGAVGISAVISYFIMKRILKPLTQMTRITGRVSAGDFSAAIPVTTRDEIGQLAHSFNRMTESLQYMEQLRKNMIADVAHEFKTPLTNIRGYLEALVDEVVPNSPETFQLLQDESERLDRLVSDILELARAGEAKIHLDILEIRLPEAIDHVYKVFRLKFDEKNITVNRKGIEPDSRVYADPHKLAQILHNLFQNGVQYTPADKEMRIFTETLKHERRIVFANTGSELRQEDIPLIFERFYRGEKSRSREFGGAGIGLAVVRDLAEAHQGQTGADLEDGELRIWLTLPRKRPIL